MNILIRTSNREEYFKRCVDSIPVNKKVRVIVSADNDKSQEYAERILKEKDFGFSKVIRVNYPKNTAGWYNNYLNDLVKESNGWTLILDDDKFLTDGALEKIISVKKNKSSVYIFKINYLGNEMPSQEYWGRLPFVRSKIDMANFVFYAPEIEESFAPVKAADYFFLKSIEGMVEFKFIDHVICVVTDVNLGKQNDIEKLPKIHFVTPYSYNKDIGKAYNDVFENAGEDDYVCIMDGDTMFLNNDFGHHIARIVKNNPDGGIFTCMTNRIGNPQQRHLGLMNKNSSMLYHKFTADRLKKTYGDSVIKAKLRTSMLVSVISKKVWKKFKFKNGMIGVDWDFSQRVLDAGIPIYIMQGIYVLHFYRLNKNEKDIKHLQ